MSKTLLNYFFCMIVSLLLVLICLITIMKFTIYNKKYFYQKIDDSNYYYKLYQDINEEINNDILSSGFNKDIYLNTYNEDEVKEDVNFYIENFYNGVVTKLNKEKLENKLWENIHYYLDKDNLEIVNKEGINSFILDISNIYKKEITLYHFLDNYIYSFYKIGQSINTIFIITIILLILFVILIKLCIKNSLLGASILSSGLILLFLRLFIYEKIDINNILIITKNFSQIIHSVFKDIMSIMELLIIELIIIGFLFIIIKVLKNVKQRNSNRILY